MATVYRVTHRTEYAYEQPVSSSYGQLHMLPRELPVQRCRSAGVSIAPEPELLRERVDFFGNRVAYFALHEPHQRLSVTVSSVVEVQERAAELSLFGQHSWEQARDTVAAGAEGIPQEVVQYVLDSPRAASAGAYRDYAAAALTPGAGVFEAVAALCSQIHADFEYRPGSTSVTTPLAEAFANRRGVCQDFAHVGIACLRSLGLPARYVSGYLETDPPPGRAKLTGADGSHAWLSVFVPEAGWVDVDPTNDQFVGDRYITTAIGRDYGDVPPMNGVIYTPGRTERLEVAVDVVALSG
ncbi:MAG TPA: transglutaminase family protein [Solirubrobacteraceae bacterium]|jgi:transglutaminase-like putative cysteine protease|nr:transglutaminase family protein [Solirubrobacteraceae bacterium]